MYARVDQIYKIGSLIQDLNRALRNMDIIESMNIVDQIDVIVGQIITQDTVRMKNAESKRHSFEPYIEDGELKFDYK